MSYDIGLTADLGGAARTGLPLDWNYTSNVVPMWRMAMPDTDGLAGMQDMKAGVAARFLRTGIQRMEADPDTYREMNPENGWGDFEGQLEQLKKLLAACEQAPEAFVEIWR